MTRETVLLAGPELAGQPDLAAAIEGTGHEVLVCRERGKAVQALRTRAVDVVVAHFEKSEPDTHSFLEYAASIAPDASLIVLAESDAHVPAYEHIERVERPVARTALVPTVSRVVERIHAEHEHETLTELLSEPYRVGCIMGGSRSVGAVAQTVVRATRGMRPVLLEGEQGTGKTLLTRVIHCAGSTRDHPYLAARGKRVTTRRLLGWRRGTFADAENDRRGLLESADGGTLCILDVEDLPQEAQNVLADVLDTGIIARCGEYRPREVSLRIIATCRGDLRRHVEQQRFREGLRYRLAEIRLRLPPLRKRMEEIPALASCFVEKHRSKLAPGCEGVSARALEIMGRHDWPGNVRELENVISHALIQSRGRRIEPGDLPSDLTSGRAQCPIHGQTDLRTACAEFERRHLLRVAERCGYDWKQCAAALGIGLSSLYRKMKEHGIKKSRGRPADKSGG